MWLIVAVALLATLLSIGMLGSYFLFYCLNPDARYTLPNDSLIRRAALRCANWFDRVTGGVDAERKAFAHCDSVLQDVAVGAAEQQCDKSYAPENKQYAEIEGVDSSKRLDIKQSQSGADKHDGELAVEQQDQSHTVAEAESVADAGKLARAASTDSVYSAGSVQPLAAAADDDAGQLRLRMHYDKAKQLFHVDLLQVSGVKPPAGTRDAFQLWVLGFLLPHPKPLWHTKVVRHPLKSMHEPVTLDEHFYQCVKANDVGKLALLCQVYTSDCGVKQTADNVNKETSKMAGQCRLILKHFANLNAPNELNIVLTKKVEQQDQAEDSIGEILLSLSYSPTSEKLLVVVSKIRGLRSDQPKDVYDSLLARIYFVLGGSVKKKRTNIVRLVNGVADFNESMFFIVPVSQCQSCYVRVSVCGRQSDPGSNNEFRTLGHATVGARCSAADGSGHWQAVMAAPRKPVPMWHPVRAKQ